MANNRIFYACQAVSIAQNGSATFTPIHGLQSVGVNTTFNLEQAFELGQIAIYENIEGLPDIEVTLEKLLDGYPLMYHLASRDATDSSLVNRAKSRSILSVGIYDEFLNNVSGNAPVEIYMSGMYFSNVSYNIVSDGNCTESLTMVGNNKEWKYNVNNSVAANLTTGSDEPLALGGSGGIQRRENVNMSTSIFPQSIYGVAKNNTAGNGYLNASENRIHVQDITISADLSRDNILELGRKGPFYRAPKYPVEVTCEFNVITNSGDWITAYEGGVPAYNNTINEGNNTTLDAIKIVLDDGTIISLGNRNRLSSVTYGGGDTGGGNVSNKYSYSTYNILQVVHPQDPAARAYVSDI